MASGTNIGGSLSKASLNWINSWEDSTGIVGSSLRSGGLRGCDLSTKALQTAREAFSRFHIHADRQLHGLSRLSLGFLALLNILGLSRLFLSLSLLINWSIEGSNLIRRMFFFYLSSIGPIFFVSSSSTLLSILRMFGMKPKPITRMKEEIFQNRHLGRFSTELFNC